MTKKTTEHDQLWAFTQKFAKWDNEVLFGEILAREKELALRQRNLMTISTLISKENFEQLVVHLKIGKENEGSGEYCLVFLWIFRTNHRRALW